MKKNFRKQKYIFSIEITKKLSTFAQTFIDIIRLIYLISNV